MREGLADVDGLVSGMTPRQWRQPLLKTAVSGTHMVQWVPTPDRPLLVRRDSRVKLLETLSNNSPVPPFHFKTFSTFGRLVVIPSADAFVVLERGLDMVSEDIVGDCHYPQSLRQCYCLAGLYLQVHAGLQEQHPEHSQQSRLGMWWMQYHTNISTYP
jgi:hypothetical protein